MESAPRSSTSETTPQRSRFAAADAGHPAIAALMALAKARSIPEEYFSEAGPPLPGDAHQSLATQPLDAMDMLAEDPRLPALPEATLRLMQMAENPLCSLNDLAGVISLDPWLTSYVLRIVNSALYSLPAKVDTISRAVAILGIKRLATLAMGASIIKGFSSAKAGPLDMQRFWRHSMACAIIAQALARSLKLDPAERFFVAGLLHDVGRLALFSLRPEAAAFAMSYCRKTGELMAVAEMQALGFDHARMGAMLLRKWNFPLQLARATLLHANPQPPDRPDASEANPLNTAGAEALVVHIADVVAKALGHGAMPYAGVPPLCLEAWTILGMRVEMLDDLATHVDACLAETAALLGSPKSTRRKAGA